MLALSPVILVYEVMNYPLVDQARIEDELRSSNADHTTQTLLLTTAIIVFNTTLASAQ